LRFNGSVFKRSGEMIGGAGGMTISTGKALPERPRSYSQGDHNASLTPDVP